MPREVQTEVNQLKFRRRSKHRLVNVERGLSPSVRVMPMLLPVPLHDACDKVSATVTVVPRSPGGDGTPPGMRAAPHA